MTSGLAVARPNGRPMTQPSGRIMTQPAGRPVSPLLGPSTTAPGVLRASRTPESLSALLPRVRVIGDEIRGVEVTATDGREDAALPDLLARIADGDSAAFAEFYDRTGDRVYGMVLRVLRDPGYSEETTQEVFLQVWRSADKFDPAAGSALSWLITLAHRRAVDRVRSEVAGDRRETTYSQATATISFDQVADAVEVREARERVINCLGSLTDIQRESVSLAYYRGLTYREVAEQLSVALPTIKSRIRDGLARLRECLGDRDV